MEEKTFYITRESAPGVLSLVRRGLLPQVVQVHENIWFGKAPETNVDRHIGLELTRAICLPALLESGIISEQPGGYVTEYRYITLPDNEKQIYLEGLLGISHFIGAKALANPSLTPNGSYIRGVGETSEVNRIFNEILGLFRQLMEVRVAPKAEDNTFFELGFLSVRGEDGTTNQEDSLT